MKNKISALLLAGLLTSQLSGCMGQMGLSAMVTKGNLSAVDNRYGRAGLFVLMSPVYGLAATADLFIINSVEFWTGTNPVTGKSPAVVDMPVEAIFKVNEIYADILETSELLQTKTPLDSRPMYRIYQNKLKAMHDDWQSRSLVRNQTIHGKNIRHSMYLLDEVMINWLIQSEREDMMSEYHMNWQQVLDSMEVLTKLRICIPDMDSIDDQQRVKFYCDKTVRKLNQLALICPLSIASPIGCRAIHELSELASSETINLSPKAMYDLTSDVSTVIAQVFDQVLSDMTESLYQPLPSIPLGIVEGHQSKHSYV